MGKIEKIVRSYLLNEATWNYHYGKYNDLTSDDYVPYYSESRRPFGGGGYTGHFGSGTYFSSYKNNRDNRINDYEYEDSTPTIVKINDSLYRVDIDIYKNLYRVKNSNEGKLLYTLLSRLDGMFVNVGEKKFNLSNSYQIVKKNCSAIGLECPSYYDLIRWMQKEHLNDKTDKRSFGTVFMEYNGFNGVNVSGISDFDNTTHGSVIYDLRKVDGEIKKLSQNINNVIGDETVANKTIASNGYDDLVSNSLNGIKTSFYEINKYDEKTQLRILKNLLNNCSYLTKNEIEFYIENDKIRLIYFKLLYKVLNSGIRSIFHNEDIKNMFFDYENNIVDFLINYKLYYWLNFDNEIFREKKFSLLVKFFDDFCNRSENGDIKDKNKIIEMRKQYLYFLLEKINRKLYDYEKEDIKNLLENFWHL